MTTTDTIDTTTPAAQARELADRLAVTITACRYRCLERERTRKLSPIEKGFGWISRPFHAYSPDAMCRGCRAYWFAEQCAQELAQADAIERRFAASKEAMRRLPQKG